MLSLEQAQEVLLKLGVCGGSGGVAGNEYHIVPVRQRVPVCAKYLAQSAAQQVAHYGMAQPLGGDNPEAGFFSTRTLARIGEGGEHKKTPCCG